MSEFIQGVENGNDGKLVVPSWGKKGKWYKVTLEKEDGKYSVKDYDSELPTVTAADYGMNIATSKDGKDFHLISVASDPDGIEPFMYPVVGKNITSDGVYAVDFNKPNTNVSLKINDTAATVQETVNGLVQKNIALSASVESGGGIKSKVMTSLSEFMNFDYSRILYINFPENENAATYFYKLGTNGTSAMFINITGSIFSADSSHNAGEMRITMTGFTLDPSYTSITLTTIRGFMYKSVIEEPEKSNPSIINNSIDVIEESFGITVYYV